VFTNGVFDILHRGHATYLDEAAQLGSVLVVGVNADASARRLGKGPDRPLNNEHDRAAFDCEEPSLNDFLKRYARQNDQKGLGRTFVAVRPGDRKIYGYYTISSGSVQFDTIPEKLPRYPIPVAHLGRLAVDRQAKGQGLGKALLADALKRVSAVADQLGMYAVEVFALNEAARDFYLKFGFRPLLDDRQHLYLPMSFIRKQLISSSVNL
jgi:cytidyltransferase-like protein